MIIDPCRYAMNDISSSIECEQLMDPGRIFWNFLERLVVGRRIWIFSFIPKKRENCSTDWYTSRRSGIWWPRLVYFHERNQPNNRVRAPIFPFDYFWLHFMSVSEEMIGNFTPHCVADNLAEGGKISVEVRTREYLAATELQFQKYLKGRPHFHCTTARVSLWFGFIFTHKIRLFVQQGLDI